MTIITGKTETGKTTIYKSIDYLFGAKADELHRPFLKSTGYDTVIDHFVTSLGVLKIIKEIDSKKIRIECSNPSIDTTKEYNCESGLKNWIGKVFNVILGFDEDFKIPKSNDSKMQRFSHGSCFQTRS